MEKETRTVAEMALVSLQSQQGRTLVPMRQRQCGWIEKAFAIDKWIPPFVGERCHKALDKAINFMQFLFILASLAQSVRLVKAVDFSVQAQSWTNLANGPE